MLALVAGPAAAQEGPGDPLVDQQPGLEALGLPRAWSTSSGEGVVIAVLDSGVDPTHPDLVDHLLTGRDLVDGDDRPDDPNGTGTHAAGVAAAVTDNGVGIAGAAPDARLLPVRVLSGPGSGRADGRAVERLRAGITWAAENGAGVIALTLGGDPDLLRAVATDIGVAAAIRSATAAGVVVVTGAADRAVPAGLPVLVVGPGDGSTVATGAVSAPGAEVLSTSPLGSTTTWPDGTDGYERLDGGAAAAHGAGTAALLVAQGLTPDEVRDLIVGTARNPDGDPALGAGTIDAAAAVAQAATIGAGTGVAPTPDEVGQEGGLPPALIGTVAVGAPLLALTTMLLLARPRRPRHQGA